ncbi:LOW QUALITY PROTEIN: Integrase [Phytophthora palmivora]|uniref:Integrase n=1 Tax=Phytophthora palmivora TaxID=4796 RepID=A0A2P4Y143_9STRA|nr:LOW QUALITY PROTEIN: Integrase [Phytophthora palmivora]
MSSYLFHYNKGALIINKIISRWVQTVMEAHQILLRTQSDTPMCGGEGMTVMSGGARAQILPMMIFMNAELKHPIRGAKDN